MDDDLCSNMSTSLISSNECVSSGGSIGNSSNINIGASCSSSSSSSSNSSSSTEQFIICCKVCGTMNGLRRCSRCKSVYYCSQAHQQVDWRVHKIECKKFAANLNPSEYQNTMCFSVIDLCKCSILRL